MNLLRGGGGHSHVEGGGGVVLLWFGSHYIRLILISPTAFLILCLQSPCLNSYIYRMLGFSPRDCVAVLLQYFSFSIFWPI